MVESGNEKGEFANVHEIEQKFAPKTPLSKWRNHKCVHLVFRLLCAFVVLFAAYELYTELTRDVHVQAPPSSLIEAVNETRAMLEAVRQANDLVSVKNQQAANEYLDGVQNVLKKRVDSRVKEISVLIVEKVQDIENQLSVFERCISNTVEGNLDFTKGLFAEVKAAVDAVTNANATSTLEDAIKRIETEVTRFTVDLDQMYSFYGRYINDILYHKAENITARIRMILVKDRKLCRNSAPQRIVLCYQISKLNYEISSNLEKVIHAATRLQNVKDVLNDFSSSLDVEHSTNMTNVFESALNDTKQASDLIVNTDDYFFGTVLKKSAYNKHLEMRDFIYRGYETAIRSLVPALEKIIRDFSVVKDSHRQRIFAVLNPEIAALSKLILSKSSLIADVSRRGGVVQSGAFKTLPDMLESKFKNASSVVNPLFETKKSQMIEGLTATLDFSLAQLLPSVATWSLLDYLPVETCPMSIDFQTYLKSMMDRRLQQDSHTVSNALKQVLEVDGELKPAWEEAEKEIEFYTESNSTSSSTTPDTNQENEVE